MLEQDNNLFEMLVVLDNMAHVPDIAHIEFGERWFTEYSVE